MNVSIIVPVYNVENVLHYCVDSILNQTFKDFELILIDDGSTDKSGEICDKYALNNSNIVVKHIENQGVSKARNTGIELAKGEYICFIDSDDFVEKNYLERMINTKEKYSDYDNVWCGMQTVDGYDNYTVLQKVVFSDDAPLTTSSNKEIMTLHEKWLDAGPVCKLYNRKVIVNNKLQFPEDISLGEDLIFNFEYLDCTNGKILVLNDPLYNYAQINDYSLGSKYYEDMFEIYKRINSVMYNSIVKWDCDESQQLIYYNSCFFSYEKVLRNTFNINSTIKNKYRYNRQIMKSDEFRTALEKSDCYINKYYRFAFNHSSYRLVRLLDRVSRIKN